MNVLNQIAAKASAARLEFLIAGGHAVIAHGYARNTFDLDLVVRRTEEQRWCVLLQEAGYRQIRKGTAFIQFSAQEQTLMPVDLMLVNDTTFLQMFESAVLLESLQPPVRTVSLRHLLALKCHAIKHGHRGRIVKDADDVIKLVGINRVNLEDAEIRGIFEKYGTTELYEKVRRATRNE